MKTIKIEDGGLWDNKEFEIVIDFEVDNEYIEKCKHLQDGKIRAIVVAYNEGGFNSTGICVDCLIEAFTEHGLLLPQTSKVELGTVLAPPAKGKPLKNQNHEN